MFEPFKPTTSKKLEFHSGYSVANTPSPLPQFCTLRTHSHSAIATRSFGASLPLQIALSGRLVFRKNPLAFTIECLLNGHSLGRFPFSETAAFLSWPQKAAAGITQVEFLYRGFGRFYAQGLWHPFTQSTLDRWFLPIETGAAFLTKPFPYAQEKEYLVHFQQDSPKDGSYLITPPGAPNHYPYYPLGAVGTLQSPLHTVEPAFFTIAFAGKRTKAIVQTTAQLVQQGGNPPHSFQASPRDTIVFPTPADTPFYMNVVEYISKGHGRITLKGPQGIEHAYHSHQIESTPGVPEYVTLYYTPIRT